MKKGKRKKGGPSDRKRKKEEEVKDKLKLIVENTAKVKEKETGRIRSKYLCITEERKRYHFEMEGRGGNIVFDMIHLHRSWK